MINIEDLYQLRKKLMDEYVSYTLGLITQEEYCTRAKPIDQAIDKLEMATLQDILAGQRSSSLPSGKQKP